MKPTEWLAGLTIGTVESVSPSELIVLLDVEAPQATALNTGAPTAFPRINSYVLVPGQSGAVVGQIMWLGVERSAFPKRLGLKDFGLIDLPYPLRKMKVVPIGTLTRVTEGAAPALLRLDRGIYSFPSVGDTVVLPAITDLKAIVEATGNDTRVEIGQSPLSSGSRITIDPDKLFGRHVAVLGNTGSGKSCTVAGLVRWSLEAALKQSTRGAKGGGANARFIIFDPNGEYRGAFADLTDHVRVFQVVPDEATSAAKSPARLKLPAWMWNAQEWYAFTSAAPKTQQPVLMHTLHELRTGRQVEVSPDHRACLLLSRYRTSILTKVSGGPPAYAEFPGLKGCHRLLARMGDDCQALAEKCKDSALREALQRAHSDTGALLETRSSVSKGTRYEEAFSDTDLRGIVAQLDKIIAMKPGASKETSLLNPDAPIQFDVDSLPEHLDFVAEQEQGAAQLVAYLSFRVRTMLADGRIRPIIDPEDPPTVAEWLGTFLGSSEKSRGSITVLDLSLVPSEILHVIVSAAGRLVFEAVQRYRRHYKRELPTVLVLEEAHSFIHQGADDPSEVPTATQLCRRTFERIAREGRKFGLGLVLASQRPSELSQTVLSQCNSFLLHRLVNDQDQKYVSRLVPDLLGDLLKELPSLPSRHAILLGWASPIPKLVRINELPPEKRPTSDDPKFWDVWTGVEKRPADWTPIADTWTGVVAPESTQRKTGPGRHLRKKKSEPSEE